MTTSDYIAVVLAILTGSASFRLGSKTVALIKVPGGPSHLTLGQALTAAEEVLAGASGTVQIGSVSVTVA